MTKQRLNTSKPQKPASKQENNFRSLALRPNANKKSASGQKLGGAICNIASLIMPEKNRKRESTSKFFRKNPEEKISSHLRLTPEEVLENWRNHFYTPAGYLYHLILALRREGWWFRIDNVSKFCRKWELNRRTFYRVKAELIVLGKLEENITGSIDLRIPGVSQNDSPVTEGSQGVSRGSQGVSRGSQGVSHGSHSSPETPSGHGLYNTTDLSQISTASFTFKEREKGEFSTGHPEPEQEEAVHLDPEAQQNVPEDPPVAANIPDWTKFSAEDAPKFFDWVLTYKIPRLPEKPASPRCAAEGWIRKQGVQLYAEYERWLAGPQSGTTASTGPPALPPPKEETPEQRLQRYQQLWRNPACRKGIRKVIEDNPDWNLEIGPDGPKEVNHAND